MQEETNDAKNALEAYIYGLRNQLHDRLAPYVQEDAKSALLARLDDLEVGPGQAGVYSCLAHHNCRTTALLPCPGRTGVDPGAGQGRGQGQVGERLLHHTHAALPCVPLPTGLYDEGVLGAW